MVIIFFIQIFMFQRCLKHEILLLWDRLETQLDFVLLREESSFLLTGLSVMEYSIVVLLAN